MKTMIAPSILSADFSRLGEEIRMINQSEAALIHVDVMDGRFVPNISLGIPVVKAIKKHAARPLDVHLMIVEPEKYFSMFADAGADYITFHIEASVHAHRHIQQIKDMKIKAGIAVNPQTPVSFLTDILADIDLVCLMGVNPGFGGQSFIPHTLEKIKQLKKLIAEKKANTLIEIDGGVTLDNAAEIIEAGADILVAGNTVFNSPEPLRIISQLCHV